MITETPKDPAAIPAWLQAKMDAQKDGKRVFIVNGTRRIRQAFAESILTSGKLAWAVVGGRRHLLGSSAFLTFPSAQRSKLGILRKVAAVRMPSYHPAGMAAEYARAQLHEYEATGKLH